MLQPAMTTSNIRQSNPTSQDITSFHALSWIAFVEQWKATSSRTDLTTGLRRKANLERSKWDKYRIRSTRHFVLKRDGGLANGISVAVRSRLGGLHDVYLKGKTKYHPSTPFCYPCVNAPKRFYRKIMLHSSQKRVKLVKCVIGTPSLSRLASKAPCWSINSRWRR